MRKIAILLLLSFAFACKRTPTPETPPQIQTKLKAAMTNFLYKQVKYDSSVVKYHILEVYYYEEATFYRCQFKVHEQERHFDTTGMMGATISKDTAKIVRLY